MKRRLFLSLPLCCGVAAAMASAAASARDAASGREAAAASGTARLAEAPRLTEAPRRIVSLGGTVTEIVYALGAGERLVGVDSSSLYPEAATRLPQVGYFRGFAVEGVVSLRPELVLASEGAGPPQALAQLGRLGVRVVTVPSQPRLESLFEAIGRVADAIGRPERGKALVESIPAELDRALADDGAGDRPEGKGKGVTAAEAGAGARPEIAAAPRALILSSHTGRLQAAGRDTAANAVLALADIANAFDAHTGYKSISAETVAALQPEIIVTSPLSMGDGGLAAFASQPGIATTPAARRGRIVVIDDLLLLGFGPRLPEALRQLRSGLDSSAEAQPTHR